MRATRGFKLDISIPEPDEEMQAYPAEAVHVRNTFIHIASPAVSLNRASLTCPSSYIGRLRDAFQQDEREESKDAHRNTNFFPRPVLCLASILDEQVPSTPEPLTRACLLPSSCYGTPAKEIPPMQAHDYVISHEAYGTPPRQIPPMQAHEGVMSHEGVCGMAASTVFSSPEHLAPEAGLVPQQYYHQSLYLQMPQHDTQMTLYSQAMVAASQAPPCNAQGTLAALPTAPSSHVPPCELQMPMHPPPAISMSLPTEPAPGSAELPSIGSKNHYIGECKPCAFLYSKGCENGAVCKFCHLCDAGEKKRRQKVKKSSFKLGGA